MSRMLWLVALWLSTKMHSVGFYVLAVICSIHLAGAGLGQADALIIGTLVEQRSHGVADGCYNMI